MAQKAEGAYFRNLDTVACTSTASVSRIRVRSIRMSSLPIVILFPLDLSHQLEAQLRMTYNQKPTGVVFLF
ncbi:hypothetical protein VB661_004134 [Salmonella enterica]|nr:hypothetical protein [Salmonella enterica]